MLLSGEPGSNPGWKTLFLIRDDTGKALTESPESKYATGVALLLGSVVLAVILTKAAISG